MTITGVGVSNHPIRPPETFLLELDEVLHPYFLTDDESIAQNVLERLMVDHVESTIQQAVRRKLGRTQSRSESGSPERNLEDICSEARLNLLRSLRQLKDQPQKPIRNLRNYVYTIALQVCDKQLRAMNPGRWRLKNQIRYLLNHHHDFALWQDEDGITFAGKRPWKEQMLPKRSDFSKLLENVGDLVSKKAFLGKSETEKLGNLANAIFENAGGPVEFDLLVLAMAKLTGVGDSGKIDTTQSMILETVADQKKGPSEQLELRMNMQKLWSEICVLPNRQRFTMIVGLQDESGRTLLPLLPLLQIATIPEIAEQIGYSEVELAEIWPQLPMDDLTISGILNITRQQVINLRKSARERLTRKMKIFRKHSNPKLKFTSQKSEGDTP
jgi:DNA-directed RNA polymerase specialized sigma24 family protein